MTSKQNPFPLHHYRFWSAFWLHMRPYLLFISGVAGWTGLALAPDLSWTETSTWLSLPAFFLAYGFGQALTDCYQTDTDRISAPYRPLSRGIVSVGDVKIVSIIGLVSVSAVLILLNYRNALLCGASIFGLVTYTYIKRNVWWAGPFYNAWIVALLPAMGYLIGTGGGFSQLAAYEPVRLLLLSFFSYANFVLIGYLKDIQADRQTGYRTFPVVFGWDRTIAAGYFFVLAGTVLTWSLVTPDPVGQGIALAGTLVALGGQLYGQFTRNKTEQNAAFPITATVRSFLLWHLAVVVAHYPALLLFAALFYGLFELVLWGRPMREQI